MQWTEIKNLSVNELNETLVKLRAEEHSLRLEAHGHTLKQVHKLKANRRTIARVLAALAGRSTAH